MLMCHPFINIVCDLFCHFLLDVVFNITVGIVTYDSFFISKIPKTNIDPQVLSVTKIYHTKNNQIPSKHFSDPPFYPLQIKTRSPFYKIILCEGL